VTRFLKAISHGFASKVFLLLLDVLGLLLIFNLVHMLRMGDIIALGSGPIWGIALITVVTLYIMDVYRTEMPITRARLPLQTFLGVLIAAVLAALFVYSLGVNSFLSIFGRGVMPIAFFLFSLWAASLRWWLTCVNQRYGNKIHWFLLMESDLAKRLQADLNDKAAGGSQWVDIRDVPAALACFPADLNVNTNAVIVGDMSMLDEALVQQILDLRFRGMKVSSYSAFYERYWSRIPVMQLSRTWFLQASGFERINDRVGLRVQRVLDVLVSFVGIIVLSPMLLLLALLVRLTSPGVAIYKQKRVGLNGKLFTLYKFRSMVMDAERDGPVWSQENDTRVTKFGKFLRATRLDELPQLLNIFRGQMSLIGPRPERPEFVADLRTRIPHYDLRHLVAPGLTGWAQVMYNYTSSVDEAARKLEYDLYYIKNHSIQLDFAILIKTIILVLRRMGR
jgi:exopolysaccharide biosynthesis polyprenyl glycosylphosphotransferase